MADSNDRSQRPILVPPALRDLLQKAANQLSLFDESKHNRAADGKFAPKGGGGAGAGNKRKMTPAQRSITERYADADGNMPDPSTQLGQAKMRKLRRELSGGGQLAVDDKGRFTLGGTGDAAEPAGKPEGGSFALPSLMSDVAEWSPGFPGEEPTEMTEEEWQTGVGAARQFINAAMRGAWGDTPIDWDEVKQQIDSHYDVLRTLYQKDEDKTWPLLQRANRGRDVIRYMQDSGVDGDEAVAEAAEPGKITSFEDLLPIAAEHEPDITEDALRERVTAGKPYSQRRYPGSGTYYSRNLYLDDVQLPVTWEGWAKDWKSDWAQAQKTGKLRPDAFRTSA